MPSLRDWLTRKQKETRRGRAELLLADRAGVWNARPENRQLPSLWQWCSIRWLTAKKTWTPPQRKMMQKATQYHVLRTALFALVLALIGLGSWEGLGRLEARQLRDRLLEANTADVPGIVKDMAHYRRWVDPLLRDAYANAAQDKDQRKQLHASLALLPSDSGQVEYLYERLLKGDPQEVVVIREAIKDHKADLTERLWTLLEDPKHDQDQRLRAACALAVYACEDVRWEKQSGDVAATLVMQKAFVIGPWTEALKGAGRWLMPPLVGFLEDEKRSVSERGLIATIYGNFAADAPEVYAQLEKRLTEQPEPNAPLEAKIALARRQASIGVALLVMGHREKAWPLLQHKADPTLRSFLLERMSLAGMDAKVLLARLAEEKNVSARRAILLSLGEFGVDRFSLAERRNHLPSILDLYKNEPDPGMHAAAEWLLRQWAPDTIKKIDQALVTEEVVGKRQYYVNKQGQTMVIIAPNEFWMGEGQEKHRRKIGRSFAMASKTVTVEQFRTIMKRDPLDQNNKQFAPTADCPVINVSWYDAAEYCNRLSKLENIPEDQWCYEPNKEGKYEQGMKVAAGYLQRTGYRLPTEAEWEYACRAGAETGYSFGEAEEILGQYGWYVVNAAGKSHPVGMKKPNDLGLYDMHGNVWQWCQDVWVAYPKGENGKPLNDKENNVGIVTEEKKPCGAWRLVRRCCVEPAFCQPCLPCAGEPRLQPRVPSGQDFYPLTALQLYHYPEGVEF